MQRNKRSFLYPKSWLDPRQVLLVDQNRLERQKEDVCGVDDALRVSLGLLLCIGNSYCIAIYYSLIYTFPTKLKMYYMFMSNIPSLAFTIL